MRTDVRRVIVLAAKDYTPEKISYFTGTALEDVLMILANPKQAEAEFDRRDRALADFQKRKKLVHRISRMRMITYCERDPHCKYSKGIPCVGPRCWKDMEE